MHTINIDQIGQNFDKQQYIDNCINENQMDIQFGYASDFKNAKILRDFMELILLKFHLSKKDIARFTLACDEMNNNAIEYGSKQNELNYLRVKVLQQNNIISLNLEVQDTGNGKHSKTAQEMEEYKKVRIHEDYTQHTSIRGRGLFLIIINIVDELYFEDTLEGGLIVGFKKDLFI